MALKVSRRLCSGSSVAVFGWVEPVFGVEDESVLHARSRRAIRRKAAEAARATLHELDATKGAQTPLDSQPLPLVVEELAVARAALERLIEAARLVSRPA